uniref:Uncharacterized protein n=1 Tax=Oryza barthii TaxID=65489 RepID=A0A0D3H206_9ORYZ
MNIGIRVVRLRSEAVMELRPCGDTIEKYWTRVFALAWPWRSRQRMLHILGRHNRLKKLQFVSLFVLARSVREVVETKAGDLRSLLCEGCTTAKSLSDDGITSIFSGVHGFGFSPWYTFTIALVEVTSTQ